MSKTAGRSPGLKRPLGKRPAILPWLALLSPLLRRPHCRRVICLSRFRTENRYPQRDESLPGEPVFLKTLCASAANAEAFDQRLVAALVPRLQIVEERAALAHELEKATARVVVLLVGLEVLGEIDDALGQNGDLHLGRTRVARLGAVFRNERLLAFCRNRHRYTRLSGSQTGRLKTRLGTSAP